MTQQQKDMFIVTNANYYPTNMLPLIAEKLDNVPEDKTLLLQTIEYKNPTTIFILSLFFGHLGVDRFLLKDTVRGVVKLVTWIVPFLLILITSFVVTLTNYEPTNLLFPIILSSFLYITNFVLVIIDWFIIQKETRMQNYKTFMEFIIKRKY